MSSALYAGSEFPAIRRGGLQQSSPFSLPPLIAGTIVPATWQEVHPGRDHTVYGYAFCDSTGRGAVQLMGFVQDPQLAGIGLWQTTLPTRAIASQRSWYDLGQPDLLLPEEQTPWLVTSRKLERTGLHRQRKDFPSLAYENA